MFDIGAIELLIIVIVAVVVIGPKDMPLAMRTAGRWIGKIRRVSAHFRSGIDAMVREAELEEMQAEWNKRNAEIMARHPEAVRPAHDGETPALPQPAGSGSVGGSQAPPPAVAEDPQMEPYDPPAAPEPAPAPSKADH